MCLVAASTFLSTCRDFKLLRTAFVDAIPFAYHTSCLVARSFCFFLQSCYPRGSLKGNELLNLVYALVHGFAASTFWSWRLSYSAGSAGGQWAAKSGLCFGLGDGIFLGIHGFSASTFWSWRLSYSAGWESVPCVFPYYFLCFGQ